MAGSTTASFWQYKRWTLNIARNMRITEPTGVELAAVRTFIEVFWDPINQHGTRPWLQDEFVEKSVTGEYDGDIANEPAHVLVEMVETIARDLDGPPIRDSAPIVGGVGNADETAAVDTLITATGNRRYGTGALFGGVAGSNITLP